MTNAEIARELRNQACRLAHEGTNLYRIRAFRQAAMAVLALPDEVGSILARGGARELQQVPGIGKRLANHIAQFVLVDAKPTAETCLGAKPAEQHP